MDDDQTFQEWWYEKHRYRLRTWVVANVALLAAVVPLIYVFVAVFPVPRFGVAHWLQMLAGAALGWSVSHWGVGPVARHLEALRTSGEDQ